MVIKLPLPQSGGLILSYKCTAACKHCMYFCSPGWEAHWIKEEDLVECLSLLSGKISSSPGGDHSVSLNHGLHFTGGEPFLNYDLLLKAVETADEYRIPSTFVETNCYWCFNDEITREKLVNLKKAGLKGMMISVNPFYAEYIPFERTERCIKISREVFGQNVMIYQLAYYWQFKQLGITTTISLEDYEKLTKNENLAQGVEMFLMGRANLCLRDFFPKYPYRVFFHQPCITPVFRNWHNHFDNYGNIMPGYCGGVSLGSWRDINQLAEEGIDLEDKPVLRFLVSEDIEKLYHFARDFGFRENPSGYL
ncbi:MAG: hypothetical protein JSV88_09145, partial [Candidatus Aminicenantes bacterium]